MSLSPLHKDKDKIEIVSCTRIFDRVVRTQHKAPPEYESYFRSYINHVKAMYGIVSSLEHVRRIRDRVLNSLLRVQIYTPEQLFDLVKRVGVIEQEEAGKFESAARKFSHSMRVTLRTQELLAWYLGVRRRQTWLLLLKELMYRWF